MPLKTMHLFFQVILTNLLLIPFSVSATVFNPLEDININLTGDTTFNYDTFTLNEGLTLNYFAPENSVIEIISEGDIFIGGDISALLDNNTTLSFTSISGSFTIAGKISASNLVLAANELVLSEDAMLSTTGADGSMLSTTGTGGSIFLSGTREAILFNPFNPGSLIINSGTIFTQPLDLTTIELQTTVPLPAPLWLFSTALLSLFTLRNAKT